MFFNQQPHSGARNSYEHNETAGWNIVKLLHKRHNITDTPIKMTYDHSYSEAGEGTHTIQQWSGLQFIAEL